MAIEPNIDGDLGSVLLEKKQITQEQLEECVERYRKKGGYLSQHLIEAGYIKDNDLTTCLTCQYGYCYLPLKSYTIEEAALQVIPARCAHDYCVIPIEKNDKLLTIVMADPLNKGVIEMLRRISRCEIVVFVGTRNEIKEAIEKHYGASPEEFKLDLYKDDLVLRDDLVTQNISNGLYNGPNRRRYRRIYRDMNMVYYVYPQVVKSKVLNLSLSGILFESNTAIPKGMQMAINLQLSDHVSVSGVLEVARCESIKMNHNVFGDDSPMFYFYEVGAFFNFLSREYQNVLANFLKERFRS